MPTGQTCGETLSWSASSISSITSKALRPSRSTLLAKVMMGMSRRRQISKSFRVWLSMPLATSTTMMALSTAVSVR